METFEYPQFDVQASIALFTGVSNAAEIRSRIVHASLMEGSQGDLEREAVNFAFVDARLITSVLHLQTAIYSALLAQAQNTLRTKTVHSEILWALNPSNNISEAIRRYGVSDNTEALFVVRIARVDESTGVETKMNAAVQGHLSPITDLVNLTDWITVKKHHKLNGEKALVNIDAAHEHSVIDEIVVSSVAMKSVAT